MRVSNVLTAATKRNSGSAAWIFSSPFGPRIALAPEDGGGSGTPPADTAKTAEPADPATPPAGDDKKVETPPADATKSDDSILLKRTPAEGEGTKKEEGDPEKKDETKTDATAPEKYELKMPEGVTLDDKALETFSPAFKELGLTNEQAQKLADQYIERQQAAAKEADDNWTAIQSGWVKDVKADKLVGGANFDANIKTAVGAIDKFGDDDLEAALTMSGLGNHPAFVRFAYRVGKAMGDDTVLKGGGGETASTETPESRMYGSTTPAKRG